MGKKEFIVKSCFYLISLNPLFFLLAILTSDFQQNFKDNTFAFISLSLFLVSFVAMWYLNDLSKDAKNLPVTVLKVANINYENLVFLATYIIPLVAIPLNTLKEKVVFVLLLLFVGKIFIRTNIFYSNPSLAILGYNIYQIEGNAENYKDCIIIIKGKLQVSDKIRCLKLAEDIYYGKKL